MKQQNISPNKSSKQSAQQQSSSSSSSRDSQNRFEKESVKNSPKGDQNKMSSRTARK